jgi:hypothetical protein
VTPAASTRPYRTILGHFRHESGHYYGYRLACDIGWLTDFRRIYGDERQGYSTAMRETMSRGHPLTGSPVS